MVPSYFGGKFRSVSQRRLHKNHGQLLLIHALIPMSVQDETKLRSPTLWGDLSLDIFSDVVGRDAHFAKCGSTLRLLSTSQPRQCAPEGVGPMGHSVKPLPLQDESSRLQFPEMP